MLQWSAVTDLKLLLISECPKYVIIIFTQLIITKATGHFQNLHIYPEIHAAFGLKKTQFIRTDLKVLNDTEK